MNYPSLGYCQNTDDFHSDDSGSSRRGNKLEPSVQSRDAFDISGQTSRDWNPVASTRVGKMSTNSTSLLDLVMTNSDGRDLKPDDQF